MSQINSRWPIIAVLMALLIAVAGCSSGSGSDTDPDTGDHPDNWVQKEKHGFKFLDTFLSDPGLCKECHGSDPVLRGGISDVSCFNSKCHNASDNGAPVAHPAFFNPPWSGPESHGAVAKMAPSDESGFAVCQVCHGTTKAPFFGGGVFGPACFNCHGIRAPHPRNWMPLDSFTHTTTDTGNAPVCANCHRQNPGTPGCFNNTLCHGAVGNPHPAGWSSATVHGPVAKDAPGATAGFQYCQVCHGPFTPGGTFNCQNCHSVVAPHPGAWMPGDTFTHTTTDPGNAPVCANCHRQNPGTAGCFNSTLCHGAVGSPHPAGWSSATVHGPVAKDAPGATAGFQYCQVCHGPFTLGGTFNCQNCHSVVAPHPGAWMPGDTFTHTTTDPGNAPVCANCHRQNPGTAGCFNSTLCHGAVGSPHPAGWSSATVHGPVAKAGPGTFSGFQYCAVCHGPFTPGGTFNCQTCHGVVAPHTAAPWRNGTFTHTNTSPGNAPVCANCHRQNPGTAGCFNNTLCH